MPVPVQDSAVKGWCTLALDACQGLPPLVPANEFHGPGPQNVFLQVPEPQPSMQLLVYL